MNWGLVQLYVKALQSGNIDEHGDMGQVEDLALGFRILQTEDITIGMGESKSKDYRKSLPEFKEALRICSSKLIAILC